MDNLIDIIKDLKKRVEELEKRNLPPPPESIKVGSIMSFAGTTPPSGYLICDGSEISRITYSNLFAVIGTTFGAGNGTTTFNLPNLKGKVPVGLDSSQSEFNTLGKTGGSKVHTLTINEMPSHTHIQNAHSHTSRQTYALNNGTSIGINGDAIQGGNNGAYGGGANIYNAMPQINTGLTTATNQNTGGSQPHNNLQPYITLNFIIKY